MTKFETTITGIGGSVTEFLGEKMYILFGENAPAELAEYCLLIDLNGVEGEILAGDTLKIGEEKYKVTAVGEAVKQNLSTLGHITLKFDGSETPELPGTLYLEDSEIGLVQSGDSISIYS
ncbi:PTS glucitol/sorbitol transporter subunit IIA [Rossellomorea marisflavi]|nr:PTS glucitol/sorbitol transporter subunit IIA [Rossellomorea marisflavi]MCM2605505.1 PTS glucitol/sorbitol transporter subunit IIA [Rossellomorea marisflavi]USK92167.1 PTS glucitol/sorbitol transporter subunit IIA [Rossellomorea marisflavi]